MAIPRYEGIMETKKEKKSTFERCITWGVPLLAIALWLGFSPRFHPQHIGPGTWHWVGMNWVSPAERKVVAKAFVSGHSEECSFRTTNHGSAKGWCWVDSDYSITLQGYGKVPVQPSCFDRIQVGEIFQRNWQWGECK